jgi:hypothetical protein
MKVNLESAGLSSPTPLTSLTPPHALGGRGGRERRQRQEAALRRRILRRLRATRGSAYLEFAFVMPLVLMTMFFAVDFTRHLYIEQQVEIATRALSDVECHLVPGRRTGPDGKSGCPGRPAKIVVRNYLAESLKNEGLRSADDVYCKGDFYVQRGPIHTIVDTVFGGIEKMKKSDNWFFKFLGKIISFALSLVTMNTQLYLSETFLTDKVVRTSVSVYVDTLVPAEAYGFFGNQYGRAMIPAYAPRLSDATAEYDRKLVADERVRYYCHMPSMDTAALAPATYIRKLTQIPLLKKWLKVGE